MKKVLLFIGMIILFGWQNLVDDQSGINGKIEDFVKDKIYPNDTIESKIFQDF